MEYSPPIQVAAMLVKVKEIESKLSSINITQVGFDDIFGRINHRIMSPEAQATTPIQRTTNLP